MATEGGTVSRERKKGTDFESKVVAYMARVLGDSRIERRAMSGTNDRGECARKVLWLDSNGVPYSAPPPRENEEKQDEGGTNQSF